jgi:hypothetical protein
VIGFKVVDADIKGLILNISASLFAIPIIIVFYELIRSHSDKKLNQEIFDYAKMQIDREIMSIINQLSKGVFPYGQSVRTPKDYNKFLSYSLDDIKNIIKNSDFIGFQVYKKWEYSENYLHETLKNPYILGKLDNEQIISIIKIIKCIRSLENIQMQENLFMSKGVISKGYNISKGSDINQENGNSFEKRYLLLKDIGEGRFMVEDFGDFEKYSLPKLLNIYKINEGIVDIYCSEVFDLLSEISNWLIVTGNEFIIDPKIFKLKRVS